MRKPVFALAFCAALISTLAFAQNVEVNRTNKTIAVTVTEKAEAEAEWAVVDLGFQSFAATRDAAVDENFRMANQITSALLKSGIPKENIETAQLRLTQLFENDKVLQQVAKERKFVVNHTWKVRVPATEAQKTVNVAMSAGANVLNGVEWTVADSDALEAKAGAAALRRARMIAEQMAAALNAKLGQLVFASNSEPEYRAYRGGGIGGGVFRVGGGGSGGIGERQEIQLFPQKVESTATVYAVFGIE